MIDAQACFSYTTYHEGENKILKVSLEKCNFPPSIEYNKICMSKVIDLLLKNPGTNLIVLTQQRQYEYDFTQTELLNELANVVKRLTKDGRFAYTSIVLDPQHERYIRGSFAKFQRIINNQLKEDPLGAYIMLRRLERHEQTKLNNLIDQRHQLAQQKFLAVLKAAVQLLNELKIIKLLMPHTKDYEVGHREIYGTVLQPTTHPDYMFTKILTEFPEGEIADSYEFTTVGDKAQVNIFTFDDNIKVMYHLTPPEFKFSEEKVQLLDDAKRIMAEHKPTSDEFVDPNRMREVFFNIGKDLMTDLITHRSLKFSEDEIDELARALLRYTIGFGLIELLLGDPKIQDVNINAPNGEIPIFVVHQDYGDCYTNIYPTREEVESWATKLRLISGRPLDEANPILDTELVVPGFTSRVSAITMPLSPLGLGFSFRRHRDFPWTFPLYMQSKIKYLDKVAAGLLSFVIANNATILIAGTRSSGKSSLLGSFLIEISRKSRILTIEDTFELPQESLRRLGYNLESLKVASALSSPGSEVDPSIGIRSTLRLGDSAIFVGEVRSTEAIALFEAMRVGAAANVVAGTIHADSPYGVYDRVVNDIGVPKTSFKAIDIIVITNPVISGTKKYKRVLRITEVRKEWDEDPLKEKAFVDLMVYNPKTDQLEVTPDLINGNSDILKRMAGRVKEFAGDWDAVWNNIILRGDAKQAIVDLYEETKDEELLEAKFIVKANDKFVLISNKIKDRMGKMDNNEILFEYKEWLKRELKKKSFNLF